MHNVPPASQTSTSSAKFKIDERRGTIAGRETSSCAQLAEVRSRSGKRRQHRLGLIGLGAVVRKLGACVI
jgi:hypothetical protein